MLTIPSNVVVVVRTDDPTYAITVSRGLIQARYPAIEITMTVPGAAEVIAELVPDAGETLIGAGTVIDPADVDRCVDAGARFVVSPITDPEVLIRAAARDVPAIPGATTPSEIMTAVRLGAAAVKVFPIALVGGPAFLISVLEPLPSLSLIASGGISLGDVNAYLAAGAHAVCVGTDVADPAAIRAGDIDAVARTAAANARAANIDFR